MMMTDEILTLAKTKSGWDSTWNPISGCYEIVSDILITMMYGRVELYDTYYSKKIMLYYKESFEEQNKLVYLYEASIKPEVKLKIILTKF